MADYSEDWHPGSFTKNFGWSKQGRGLSELHRAIRIGFARDREDVPRKLFRSRLRDKKISFYVPANFFLFNYTDSETDWIAYDELAFQAINFEHSLDFDRLGLFSFNLSLVGSWKGARPFQRRPALWSNRYIVERLARQLDWDVSKVSANDIQNFVDGDDRYRAQTSRKLSTNLSYLYTLGGLEATVSRQVELWWMNAAFLAADRLSRLKIVRRLNVRALSEAFEEFEFFRLTGDETVEKKYALGRLLDVYVSVGGFDRFRRSAEFISSGRTNDPRPYGLVDKKLPRAPKALPAGVANILHWLDNSYDHLDYDGLREFDIDAFVRDAAVRAFSSLKERGISPIMNSDELMKLMRD